MAASIALGCDGKRGDLRGSRAHDCDKLCLIVDVACAYRVSQHHCMKVFSEAVAADDVKSVPAGDQRGAAMEAARRANQLRDFVRSVRRKTPYTATITPRRTTHFLSRLNEICAARLHSSRNLLSFFGIYDCLCASRLDKRDVSADRRDT